MSRQAERGRKQCCLCECETGEANGVQDVRGTAPVHQNPQGTSELPVRVRMAGARPRVGPAGNGAAKGHGAAQAMGGLTGHGQ